MNNAGFATSARAHLPITSVAVIGSGLMGSGIAQVSASSGMKVVMVDQNDKILKKSIDAIDKSIGRVAKKKVPDDTKGQAAFKEDTMSRLTTSTDLKKAVSDVDLVIEAIVENVDIKRKLFAEIESVAQPKTILATNTSSLSLSDIMVNMRRKEQFGGLHFFNPVPVMQLLEVVRSGDTSDATFESLLEFGKQLGKTTVKCKDTPGFIVNRLLVPYMMEALRMAERGDSSYRDIDIAMKLGAGYPMGPFELSDYVGLDTTKFIIDGWHKKYPDNPLFKPSKKLDQLVKDGKLGRKTGEGFYKH